MFSGFTAAIGAHSISEEIAGYSPYYPNFCTIVGLPEEPPVDRLVQSLIPVYQLIRLLI